MNSHYLLIHTTVACQSSSSVLSSASGFRSYTMLPCSPSLFVMSEVSSLCVHTTGRMEGMSKTTIYWRDVLKSGLYSASSRYNGTESSKPLPSHLDSQDHKDMPGPGRPSHSPGPNGEVGAARPLTSPTPRPPPREASGTQSRVPAVPAGPTIGCRRRSHAA